MAFEWQNTLEGKIEAQAINEIKNNVNSLASNLGLNLSWSDVIASGELIKKSTLQEFQNNIDYIDDNKQCLNDYSDNYSNVNSTNNITIDNDQYGIYDQNDHASICSSENSSIYNSAYSSEDYGDYSSVNGVNRTGDDETDYSEVNDAYDSTVDSTRKATDDNGYDNGIHSSKNTTVNITQNSNVT